MSMPKYNANLAVKFFDDSTAWNNCLGKTMSDGDGIDWDNLDDIDQLAEEDNMTQKRRVQFRLGNKGDNIVDFFTLNANATGTTDVTTGSTVQPLDSGGLQ